MSQNVTLFRIMIAAPSDVRPECDSVFDAIHKWNNMHSMSTDIVLLPLYWEKNVAQGATNNVQEMIESDIIPLSDLVIGIFGSTLGSEDVNGLPRTVNEINKHINQNKQVAVFFKSNPSPKNEKEAIALKNLFNFKENIKNYLNSDLLYREYKSKSFKAEIYNWLELFVNKHILSQKSKFVDKKLSFDDIAKQRSMTLQTKIDQSKKSLFISGVSLVSTLTTSFDNCIRNNINTRLLFTADSQELIKRNAQLSYTTPDELSSHIHAARKRLKEANLPRNFEIRYIDLVLPFALVGNDIEEPDGKIYVQQYFYKTAPALTPNYICYHGEKWFEMYREQIETMWADGKKFT